MMRVALLLLMACIVNAQSPGNGISKSTYAANDPIPGKTFMYKYFPVGTPGDECTNDDCDCGTWHILQGRVYTLESESSSANRKLQQSAGKGFGLHLVNVSQSRTTGGMTTADVEAEFTSKLGDMTKFDSFMDFNVMFYTTGLAAYASTFKADSVPFYTTTWSYQNQTWTSLFVHVPNTQLILELCQNTTLGFPAGHHETQRATSHSLERVLAMAPAPEDSATSTGALLTPLAVNRATSAATFAKLEDFYVTGMGTTMKEDTKTSAYSRKCFLWPGSYVDICFYTRPDSETKGDFKVGSFEDMMNKVHSNIVGPNPTCNRDKWMDNHYAIDSFSADTSKILSYIESAKPYHYCDGAGGGGSSGFGASLHYVCDPTGWCIQLDLQFSSAPTDCSSSGLVAPLQTGARKLLQGPGNPQCTASC